MIIELLAQTFATPQLPAAGAGSPSQWAIDAGYLIDKLLAVGLLAMTILQGRRTRHAEDKAQQYALYVDPRNLPPTEPNPIQPTQPTGAAHAATNADSQPDQFLWRVPVPRYDGDRDQRPRPGV